MRSFLIELARVGGRIALEHYQQAGMQDRDAKGRGDYVSYVDRRVEDVIATRIRSQYPDHRFLGEETHGDWPERVDGPCWLVDPIDGTTNYLRGIPYWAVSICFCDADAVPRHAVVFDPLRSELFLAERGAGLWLNDQRVYAGRVERLHDAVFAGALPFRTRAAMDDVAQVLFDLQRDCDDFRRCGAAALDLAYVAVGRLDAYWELGIQPWDTAAGELLVRAAGGVASDFRGSADGLLGRRSICAAGTAAVHEQLLERLSPLRRWLDDPLYRGVGGSASGV